MRRPAGAGPDGSHPIHLQNISPGISTLPLAVGGEFQDLTEQVQTYWFGQKVHIFFHKVKDTFFFSPITLLIWIF